MTKAIVATFRRKIRQRSPFDSVAGRGPNCKVGRVRDGVAAVAPLSANFWKTAVDTRPRISLIYTNETYATYRSTREVPRTAASDRRTAARLAPGGPPPQPP